VAKSSKKSFFIGMQADGWTFILDILFKVVLPLFLVVSLETHDRLHLLSKTQTHVFSQERADYPYHRA
jgi:hypothetical protein